MLSKPLEESINELVKSSEDIFGWVRECGEQDVLSAAAFLTDTEEAEKNVVIDFASAVMVNVLEAPLPGKYTVIAEITDNLLSLIRKPSRT